MDKIVNSFWQSILENSKDVLMDFLEIGIDHNLDDSLIKEIPIIKIIYALGETGNSIRERNLMKQTAAFIVELRRKNIASTLLNKKKKEYEGNPKKAEKELSRVLLILNEIIDTDKSNILANFYRGLILEYIDWQKFHELTEVLRSIYLNDLKYLKKIYNGEISKTLGKNYEDYRFYRLYGAGLIETKIEIYMDGDNMLKKVLISPLGRLFIEQMGTFEAENIN